MPSSTQHQTSRKRGIITKEVIVGLLAIALGSYNLLSKYGRISWKFEVSQDIANIILVIAGIALWVTAFKLWRYRWHAHGFI